MTFFILYVSKHINNKSKFAKNEDFVFHIMYFFSIYLAAAMDSLFPGIKSWYCAHVEQEDDLSWNILFFSLMLGIEKFDTDNFYEHNKKNIADLTKWALDYKSSSEYKNIIMEINLGNEKTMDLLFENMYVENFEQEFDIEKGNGEFLLELKQKYYSGNKIRIE